jgi:DNA modification methylase
MDKYRILQGDVRQVLAQLTENSVHCIVTSPPYWGLRAYKTEPQIWGGDPKCKHSWNDTGPPGTMIQYNHQDTIKTYPTIPPDASQKCSKCGAWQGELGLESVPEEYIAHLVEVFRVAKRVLRDDGTLWVNIGDTYANAPRGSFNGGGECLRHGQDLSGYATGGTLDKLKGSGLKAGDRVGIPFMLSLALRSDGWFWRSDSLWLKSLSFCPSYVGSCMPESVSGVRWVKHRIKIKGAPRGNESYRNGANEARPQADHNGKDFAKAEYQDCPGCEKCNPNGGLILKRGAWRPTRSHEYIMMFTKKDEYFGDMDAVREATVDYETERREREEREGLKVTYEQACKGEMHEPSPSSGLRTTHRGSAAGRNLRTAWVIQPEPLPKEYKHFASFPTKLVEPCIKVSTSEYGCCPKCGANWARIVEQGEDDEEAMDIAGADSEGEYHGDAQKDYAEGKAQDPSATKARILAGMKRRITKGWKPTCDCGEDLKPIACTVLDPFSGTGTTVMVAVRLARHGIGIELNPMFVEMSKKRILTEPAAKLRRLDDFMM